MARLGLYTDRWAAHGLNLSAHEQWPPERESVNHNFYLNLTHLFQPQLISLAQL